MRKLLVSIVAKHRDGSVYREWKHEVPVSAPRSGDQRPDLMVELSYLDAMFTKIQSRATDVMGVASTVDGKIK